VRCVQRLVLVGDARVYSTGVQSHIFKVWRRPATFPTFWIIKHEKTVCKFPSKSAAGVVIMVVRRLNLILPQNPTPVRKNSEIEPWSGLWLWFRSGVQTFVAQVVCRPNVWRLCIRRQPFNRPRLSCCQYLDRVVSPTLNSFVVRSHAGKMECNDRRRRCSDDSHGNNVTTKDFLCGLRYTVTGNIHQTAFRRLWSFTRRA